MDIHDFYAHIKWEKRSSLNYFGLLKLFSLSVVSFFSFFCITAIFIYGLINHDSTWVNVGVTFVLVIITAYYAYLTQKLRDSSEKQLLSSQNPIIGVRICRYGLSPTFGESRRSLSIEYNLENIGNSSAIEILVDSEIELPKSTISGQKKIPSRFYPTFIPYLKPNESLLVPQNNEKGNCYIQSYGNTLIHHLLLDYFGENYQTKVPQRSNAKIFMWDEDLRKHKANITFHVYYKNSLSQYFESTLKQYIHIWRPHDHPDEVNIYTLSLKGESFNSKPIAKDQMDNDIRERDQKRELCGW